MTATGSAASAEQAKARALSNLAKIFEVHIREVSTTSQDIKTRTTEGVETVEHSVSIASRVNLKTDKMVQGARIAAQWQSIADRTYYALAVLDRSHAGNNIREEMNRLDEETRHVLKLHESRKNALLKIADLDRAYELQQNRRALQQTLKIIDIQGKGAVAQWNLTELSEQRQQALRALPLKTGVKQDDIGGLAAMMQGAVSAVGFSSNQQQNPHSYQLVASLQAQPVIKHDGWYWLRATLKVELIAKDGIRVIGYQAWPLKVSASDNAQLISRMQKAVDSKLKRQLLLTILEFVA